MPKNIIGTAISSKLKRGASEATCIVPDSDKEKQCI